MEKENFPGLWDISAAGHVSAGEKPKEAALRELGITANPKDLKKVMISKAHSDTGNYHNREFDDVYIFRFNLPSKRFMLQKDEVDAIKFISIKKFEKELRNPKTASRYVPHRYYFDLIKVINKELKKINKDIVKNTAGLWKIKETGSEYTRRIRLNAEKKVKRLGKD